MSVSFSITGNSGASSTGQVQFYSTDPAAASTAGVPNFKTLLRGNPSFVASPDEPQVTETWLISKDRPELEIRQHIYEMDLILRAAREYHTNPRRPAVWLNAHTTAESNRRSLVYNYRWASQSNMKANPFLTNKRAELMLALTRANFWESDTLITKSKDNVSASGGRWLLHDTGASGFGDTVGDVNPRIAQFAATFSSNQLAKAWIGIHATSGGAGGGADYWIECEAGTPTASSDTDEGADATYAYSGASVVRTNFATVPTMAQRFTITATQAGVDGNNYIGSYRVLLRCRLTAAGEVGIRLRTRYGTNTAAPSQYQAEQYLTSTVYTLLDLGQITLPPHAYRTQTAFFDLADFTFAFEAELLSGTPSLYCDSICLMPADHLMVCEIGNPAAMVSDAMLHVITYENDVIEAWASTSTAVGTPGADIIQGVEPETRLNWSYPFGGGMLVFAAVEGTTKTHSLNRNADLVMSIYPRYMGYRPD